MRPLRVVVLSGGPSAERAVSLASGAAVASALSSCGHSVEMCDPVDDAIHRVNWQTFDVAFIALHGTYGEDGQVQQFLDEQRIPYTGSDAEASRIAFSKLAAKRCFRAANSPLPTPSEIVVTRQDDFTKAIPQAATFGLPLVVKPDKQGSSLGVSVVTSIDDLPAALTTALELDDCCLIEQAIIGTEWTLGLIDDQPLPLIHTLTAYPTRLNVY